MNDIPPLNAGYLLKDMACALTRVLDKIFCRIQSPSRRSSQRRNSANGYRAGNRSGPRKLDALSGGFRPGSGCGRAGPASAPTIEVGAGALPKCPFNPRRYPGTFPDDLIQRTGLCRCRKHPLLHHIGSYPPFIGKQAEAKADCVDHSKGSCQAYL